MGEKIQVAFEEFMESLIVLLPNFLAGLVVFLLFWTFGFFIKKLFAKGAATRWKDSILASYIGKLLGWTFYLIGSIAALHIMGFGGVANSLMAGAGVSAIIVGFAFKDIAENFLAGLLLLVSRPFEIGNIIEVSGAKGTVREMDIRTTHLRNIEGKDIYIPNSMIIKNPVINYTKDGLLRMDFLIGLDVPTDIAKVKKMLLEYLSKQPEVLKTPEYNVLTQNLGEFTVDVKVLFWIDVFKNKKISPSYLGETIRSRIMREIKDLLLENGYNLPSQVIEHKMYNDAAPLKIESK